jgi:hypothetical protein
MPEECSRHRARVQMLNLLLAQQRLCWLGDWFRKIRFQPTSIFLRPGIASAGPMRLRHAPAPLAIRDSRGW